jgi:hypothetical protein
MIASAYSYRIKSQPCGRHTFPAQQAKAAIGVAVVNRMLATGRPNSVRRQLIIA